MKEITANAKLFIFYLKALITNGWWKDAQTIMNEVGVYYHDLDLVEAIVRNINALIMS